jgi:hypothetical protein
VIHLDFLQQAGAVQMPKPCQKPTKENVPVLPIHKINVYQGVDNGIKSEYLPEYHPVH